MLSVVFLLILRRGVPTHLRGPCSWRDKFLGLNGGAKHAGLARGQNAGQNRSKPVRNLEYGIGSANTVLGPQCSVELPGERRATFVRLPFLADNIRKQNRIPLLPILTTITIENKW